MFWVTFLVISDRLYAYIICWLLSKSGTQDFDSSVYMDFCTVWFTKAWECHRASCDRWKQTMKLMWIWLYVLQSDWSSLILEWSHLIWHKISLRICVGESEHVFYKTILNWRLAANLSRINNLTSVVRSCVFWHVAHIHIHCSHAMYWYSTWTIFTAFFIL